MRVVVLGGERYLPDAFVATVSSIVNRAINGFKRWGEYCSEELPADTALLYVQLSNRTFIYRDRLDRAGLVMIAQDSRIVIMNRMAFRQLHTGSRIYVH